MESKEYKAISKILENIAAKAESLTDAQKEELKKLS